MSRNDRTDSDNTKVQKALNSVRPKTTNYADFFVGSTEFAGFRSDTDMVKGSNNYSCQDHYDKNINELFVLSVLSHRYHWPGTCK
ncbi:MAG: hypothetical protein ACI8PB_004097 [Desulforhopalus sp.]|jgi:hypothetical protein